MASRESTVGVRFALVGAFVAGLVMAAWLWDRAPVGGWPAARQRTASAVATPATPDPVATSDRAAARRTPAVPRQRDVGDVRPLPAPKAAEAASTIRVRVVDAVTHEAVAGARVLSLRDSPLVRHFGAGRPEDVLAEGTTAADGFATLSADSAESVAWVAASALGRAPGIAAVEPHADPAARIALTPGLDIAGVVVDPAGVPVPGVTIHARHHEVPAATLALGLVTSGPASCAEAVSDARGRFRLTGLSAGMHWLAPRADGWERYVRRGHGARPEPEHVLAGTRDVGITVVAVRVCRLRFLDATTELPIGAGPPQFAVERGPAVRFLDGRAPGERPVWAGATWLPVQAVGDRTGVLQFDTGGPIPDRVTLKGQVPFYQQVQVTGVRLGLPSALAAGGWVDDVRLLPEGGEGRGAIRAHCDPRLAGLAPSRGGPWVWIEAEGHVAGRWDGPTTLLASTLPAGRHDVIVFDGIRTSEPIEVIVLPGTTVDVTPRFPAPSGVTLVVRDDGGRRLFDARVMYRPDDASAGRRWHEATNMRMALDLGSYIPDEATGEPLEPVELFVDQRAGAPVHDLAGPPPPGRYRFVVQKAGHQPQEQIIDVRAGEITRAEITLLRQP